MAAIMLRHEHRGSSYGQRRTSDRQTVARQRHRHHLHLSGGHLFSIYDGCRAENIRLIDTPPRADRCVRRRGLSKVTRMRAASPP